MERMEQCQIWHENDEYSKIIDALEAISEEERTPEEDLELARAYRFSRRKTLRLVYLPSLNPYLRSALTTATGLAWKSGVAAEVLCLPRPGICTEINRSKQAFETADLFAWTAVVILLSLLMEYGLTRLLRKRGEVP